MNTPTRVHVFADAVAMGRRVARFVADRILARPDLVVALPTGDTPRPLYEALRRLHRDAGLRFARTRIFNLDEYVGLPRGHAQSFATYMQESLLAHVDVTPGHHHVPDSAALDPAAEARRYEDAVRAVGPIALAVLGIGTNGHIAFNEPADTFTHGVYVAELSAETRSRAAAHFGDLTRVPRQAITMGIGMILESREIAILASGEAKAAALARALTGPRTPAVPASAIQGHRAVTVFADRAAARDLLAAKLPEGMDVDEDASG